MLKISLKKFIVRRKAMYDSSGGMEMELVVF